MSHEFRTPLNAILGFGQLLQLKSRSGQDAEYLVHILKAGERLLALVDQVLDLSQAESGELSLMFGAVDAHAVAGACVQLVTPMATANGVTCEGQNTGTPVLLWCDEQRLRQILLNLLSNAIKYNRRGGRVVVRCERAPDGRSRLLVSDTGHGIAPDDLARLFLPFERLEQADSGKVKGVGLSLVVSRRLVESMGGRMGVNSSAGDGSTFWLELPNTK